MKKKRATLVPDNVQLNSNDEFVVPIVDNENVKPTYDKQNVPAKPKRTKTVKGKAGDFSALHKQKNSHLTENNTLADDNSVQTPATGNQARENSKAETNPPLMSQQNSGISIRTISDSGISTLKSSVVNDVNLNDVNVSKSVANDVHLSESLENILSPLDAILKSAENSPKVDKKSLEESKISVIIDSEERKDIQTAALNIENSPKMDTDRLEKPKSTVIIDLEVRKNMTGDTKETENVEEFKTPTIDMPNLNQIIVNGNTDDSHKQNNINGKTETQQKIEVLSEELQLNSTPSNAEIKTTLVSPLVPFPSIKEEKTNSVEKSMSEDLKKAQQNILNKTIPPPKQFQSEKPGKLSPGKFELFQTNESPVKQPLNIPPPPPTPQPTGIPPPPQSTSIPLPPPTFGIPKQPSVPLVGGGVSASEKILEAKKNFLAGKSKMRAIHVTAVPKSMV